MGTKSKKERLYIYMYIHIYVYIYTHTHIANSLRCAAKTNTTLQSNCIPIKSN